MSPRQRNQAWLTATAALSKPGLPDVTPEKHEPWIVVVPSFETQPFELAFVDHQSLRFVKRQAQHGTDDTRLRMHIAASSRASCMSGQVVWPRGTFNERNPCGGAVV